MVPQVFLADAQHSQVMAELVASRQLMQEQVAASLELTRALTASLAKGLPNRGAVPEEELVTFVVSLGLGRDVADLLASHEVTYAILVNCMDKVGACAKKVGQ